MKKNIIATSIVEAMVVLLIVMLAVTSAYDMFTKSVQVTDSNGHKLQAISMAKEWIEAMINIRDTNWKIMPWDYKNCWNTLNYDTDCLNSNTTIYDIPNNSSFTISKDPVDYRWKLTQQTSWLYSSWAYRTSFWVWYDTDWFYTQNSTLFDPLNPLFPIFTREIKIQYLNDWYTWWAVNSDHQKIQVTSLVQWKDQSSAENKKLELTTVLTNWRNKN